MAGHLRARKEDSPVSEPLAIDKLRDKTRSRSHRVNVLNEVLHAVTGRKRVRVLREAHLHFEQPPIKLFFYPSLKLHQQTEAHIHFEQ